MHGCVPKKLESCHQTPTLTVNKCRGEGLYGNRANNLPCVYLDSMVFEPSSAGEVSKVSVMVAAVDAISAFVAALLEKNKEPACM